MEGRWITTSCCELYKSTLGTLSTERSPLRIWGGGLQGVDYAAGGRVSRGEDCGDVIDPQEILSAAP